MIAVVGVDPSLALTGVVKITDEDGIETRRVRTPVADGTVLGMRRRLRWIVS